MFTYQEVTVLNIFVSCFSSINFDFSFFLSICLILYEVLTASTCSLFSFINLICLQIFLFPSYINSTTNNLSDLTFFIYMRKSDYSILVYHCITQSNFSHALASSGPHVIQPKVRYPTQP